MDVLGGKWTVVLLAQLKERDLRYAELRKRMPGISEKVLAERLRALVDQGLVHRTQVSATPPHVSYSLNECGRTLVPALEALHAWGREWAQQNGYDISVNRPSESGDLLV